MTFHYKFWIYLTTTGTGIIHLEIMVQAKIWILRKYFDGFPKDSNFELKVEELPEPKDGGKINY